MDVASHSRLYTCECGQTKNETTTRVYFENNWGWTNVYAYAWTEGQNSNASWPGAKLNVSHKVSNGDVYYYDIDLSKYDMIIFSGIKNDGSGNRDQTPNINIYELAQNNTFYMIWDNGNKVGMYHNLP